MKEYAFGIDLGGTTAKIGLFTTSGALLEKWEVATDTSNAGEHILENLAAAILGKMKEQSIQPGQVEGVGIGVPGPVLDSSTVPIVCANLGGWGERNVSAQLSGLLDGADDGQTELYTLLDSGEVVDGAIKFPAGIGKTWSFKASVVKFKTGAQVGDAISFDAELAVSGKPTLAASTDASV